MSQIKHLIKRDFNNASEQYNMHSKLQYNVTKKLFNLCHDFIKQDNIVLDAGCGTGYLRKFFQKNFTCKLFETDISENMCQFIKNNSDSGDLNSIICSDIENLPFKNNSFDVFISSMVFQWLDIKTSFLEVSRVLSEKGLFFISLVSENSLNELKESINDKSDIERVYNFIKQTEIEEIIKENKNLEISYLKKEKIVYYYQNLKDILTCIKAIGGNYKRNNISYPGKNFFLDVEKYYLNKFSTKEGIPVTWEIIYLYGTKKN